MADLKKLAEDISKLSLVDAVELKNLLKDEYGIEPAAGGAVMVAGAAAGGCLLYTSPSPRDLSTSRMPSSA